MTPISNTAGDGGGRGPSRPAEVPPTVLLFRVGSLRLGIDVRRVREVTREIPVEIPLPESDGVAGLLTLRGRTTAVLDMNAILNAPRDAAVRRGRLILLRPLVPAKRTGSSDTNASEARHRSEESRGRDGGGTERTTGADQLASSVCLRVDSVDRLWRVQQVDTDSKAGWLACLPVQAIARTADDKLLGIIDVEQILNRVGDLGQRDTKEGCGCGH